MRGTWVEKSESRSTRTSRHSGEVRTKRNTIEPKLLCNKSRDLLYLCRRESM